MGLLGTSVRYSTAYHPQTQGIAESTNAVVSHLLRCTIQEMNELREWKISLPTIELAINSSLNRGTGYTPFFLNYGFDPVVLVDLIKVSEQVRKRNCRTIS